MDDDYILEHGGTEEDIIKYAEQNGADLTLEDIIEDQKQKLFRLWAKYKVNSVYPLSIDQEDYYYHKFRIACESLSLSEIQRLIESYGVDINEINKIMEG